VSAEENKAVIRRHVEEVYNEGNLDVADELVAHDVYNHPAVPEHKHGVEGFKHVIEWVRAIGPDTHYEIDDMIAEGARVAVRMTVSGKHTSELRGIPRPEGGSRSTTCTGSVSRTRRWRSCGP
jgi:predicted ester cyclase